MVKKLVKAYRSLLKCNASLVKRSFQVSVPVFPFKINLQLAIEIKLEKLISKR